MPGTMVFLNKANFNKMTELGKARGTNLTKEVNKVISCVDPSPDKRTVILSIPQDVVDSGDVERWIAARAPSVAKMFKEKS